MVHPTLSEADFTARLEAYVSSFPRTLPALSPVPSLPSDGPASLIDHTLLAPSASVSAIKKTCAEAREYGASTVCVNASWLPLVASELDGCSVKPIAVVGFPFGAGNTIGKAEEARQAIKDGAKEIDMVQNVGLVKSGLLYAAYLDVHSVLSACSPVPVKVILETCSLTRQELLVSSAISVLAGADFIKTSTGYGTSLPDAGKTTTGATPEDVRLMRQVSLDLNEGRTLVKASGGVRTLEAVKQMVENGAARVGASGTRSIVEGYKASLGGAEAKPSQEAVEATASGY